MSVKYYGIYLAYAPTVNLRHEGLGRYLAAFLKGAAKREDVRFLLVCPSWSKKELEELFASEGVPKNLFEIRSPKGKPLILRGYEAYHAYKQRDRRPSLYLRLTSLIRKCGDTFIQGTEERLVKAYSFSSLLPVLFSLGLSAVIAIALSPLLLIAGVVLLTGMLIRTAGARLARPLHSLKSRFRFVLFHPKESDLVLRLYDQMQEAESKRMLELIDRLPHVRAWYSPTIFWPAFNQIRKPKLLCVPDVVLIDFPVGFSEVGGDRFLSTFKAVETTIRSGQHFVTYSEAVKRETLIDRYAVRASNIVVVHHAPNDLSRWVSVSGFDDTNATSHRYCESLLRGALQKAPNSLYSKEFLNSSLRFLFYASQFRPNKNLISLLKAYEYLLRNRLIGHKLILTGNPGAWPPIQQFISDHCLENDVLCLHQLKIEELAACYKLADLAINPSLSEGGCPFTFAEALSVDTPVVMARIPVTEEVLINPELQEMTFFDPYDWKDIAFRVEWALNNRDQLLALQRRTYVELARRNWTDVVNEHIEILERIACLDEQAQSPGDD